MKWINIGIKPIKGKDIVREENTKPKDKKKDGTAHPKS